MGNYFTNLFTSWKPGGQTPWQALWDAPEGTDSVQDWIDHFYDRPSSMGLALGLYDLDSNGSETVFNPGSESPTTSFDYSSEVSDIYQAVIDATDLQNQTSQSSADRAMEFSEEQARIAREFNAAQAQKAMDYQTEMFGKRYQMTMEDLRKAGLNPKLVGSLGSPSAPSGVAASASAPEGINANMNMQNISALAGVLETYMTNVNALDRKDTDFVQDVLTTILSGLGLYVSSKYGVPTVKAGTKIGF